MPILYIHRLHVKRLRQVSISFIVVISLAHYLASSFFGPFANFLPWEKYPLIEYPSWCKMYENKQTTLRSNIAVRKTLNKHLWIWVTQWIITILKFSNGVKLQNSDWCCTLYLPVHLWREIHILTGLNTTPHLWAASRCEEKTEIVPATPHPRWKTAQDWPGLTCWM